MTGWGYAEVSASAPQSPGVSMSMPALSGVPWLGPEYEYTISHNRRLLTQWVDSLPAHEIPEMGVALRVATDVLRLAAQRRHMDVEWSRRAQGWTVEVVAALVFLAQNAIKAVGIPISTVMDWSERVGAHEAATAVILADPTHPGHEHGAVELKHVIGDMCVACRVAIASYAGGSLYMLGLVARDLEEMASRFIIPGLAGE